ncbi:MAG: MGMT family protein [Candidatus Omnitrophica bacterium]|nr:MGMT family protein [Candidatus Omnitrophota bacterium]
MKEPQKISLNIAKSIDIIIKRFTPFEKDVLRAVIKIKPGQVRTYKWIAGRIGRPNAQRAVGQALNKNPLPLLIPCHRVVATNSRIGGYSRGTALKKKLLDFERNLIYGRKKSNGSK